MKTLAATTRAARFLVFNLLVWMVICPLAVLVLLAWPFGHRYAYFVARAWAIATLWLVKNICGLHLQIEGMENIPTDGCVFFFKHSSALETFAPLALFPRSCWVLKRELLWIPFFGWTLIPLDSIAIDRSKRSAAVSQIIEQGKERLQRGINIVIYPEGTRMPVGTTKRYGISGTLLAQESGAFIIPVAHNAGAFWPRHGLGIKPGLATIRVGKPIDARGKDPRELNSEIQDWVEGAVAELLCHVDSSSSKSNT
jgi:1-acyl-sn-glycerol-3-phosphate acyltransferase